MSLKIVYMGTPGFAVPPLKRLIESRHTVTAVVTQPDRASGRGRKMHFPPVKELALDHHLPVLQPPRLRGQGFEHALKVYAPDVIVVAAYGQILPKELLELPRLGCLNIHASLLPKYRGAAPIQWAIIRGERQTGVTIMQMDEGLDTGPIIAMETVDILEDDDTRSVSNMLSVMGGELLLRVLDDAERDGTIASTPQDHAAATYAPLLTKRDGLIDWNLTCEEIICRIRGLTPWPMAFTFLSGKVLRVLGAEPWEPGLSRDDTGETVPAPKSEETGTVTALIKGRGFLVQTGDGALLVTAVQPAGAAAMSAVDATNGKRVKEGNVLVSDPNFLEGADGIA